MKRHKMSRKHSKKNFRSGQKFKAVNVKANPMRGGFRI